MNGFTKALIFILMILCVAGAGIGVIGVTFLSKPPSTSDQEVIFEVKPGESFRTVTQHLHDSELITSAWKLQAYARLTGAGVKVRVGEYALARNMGPRQILSILESGHSIEHTITIPEGYNRFEIAEIVAHEKIAKREDFLKVTSDPKFVHEILGEDEPSLEGYLFPDTYSYTKYTGAKALIKVMVEHFKESYRRAQASPNWSKGGLTDREIVTLASIVEKETGAPEERPVISSVFHNRLRLHMPLQTDPTIIYGLWEKNGSWNRNISKADLTTPGKWNSYLNQGLPPGPISNPGFEALKAAGAPTVSEFLFFVSRNNGTHVFSKEYAQHLKAVSDFQLNRAARESGSWRDLNKRTVVPDKVYEAPVLHAAPAKK